MTDYNAQLDTLQSELDAWIENTFTQIAEQRKFERFLMWEQQIKQENIKRDHVFFIRYLADCFGIK